MEMHPAGANLFYSDGWRDMTKLTVIIFINCNWVITRWQWLFYMYTNTKKSN